MVHKTYVFLVLVLAVFLFPQKALSASSMTISGMPSIIDQSQEFMISLFLSCSGCSDSYIRGVFYPSGTSYFGYTQDNNGSWSNSPGSGCTSYYKVAQTDLISGSWSGTLKFKPDKDSVFYNGPGEYTFKLGRYTASCGSPSLWSNETTIALTGPTPTPTSSPATSTVTPVPTSTVVPTKTPTLSPTPTLKVTPTKRKTVEIVLGVKDKVSPTKVQERENLSGTETSKISPSVVLFFLIGSVFLSGCGILAWRNFDFLHKKKGFFD